MSMENLVDLNSDDYMVIDMDTGTVLGTNLVIVPVPASEEEIETVSSSDSAAFDYGETYGIPLLVDIVD